MNIPDITAQINEWTDSSLAETMGCPVTAKAIKALPLLLETLELAAIHTHAMTLDGTPVKDRKRLAKSLRENINKALIKAGATE